MRCQELGEFSRIRLVKDNLSSVQPGPIQSQKKARSLLFYLCSENSYCTGNNSAYIFANAEIRFSLEL